MVVGCCPGVQALTVSRCFVVTPVDVLAVEVTSVQTGVCERRYVRLCGSRAWRFVDVNDLVSCDVYAGLAQGGFLPESGRWDSSIQYSAFNTLISTKTKLF